MAQHQPLAHHKMSRAKKSGKHGCGALAGLLCYGRVLRTHEPRDVAEEAMSCFCEVREGWLHGRAPVRKGRSKRHRGACLDVERKNKFTFETHCGTDEYFHASINAEMLTIAVRTCRLRGTMVSIRTVLIVVRVRCLARRREPQCELSVWKSSLVNVVTDW